MFLTCNLKHSSCAEHVLILWWCCLGWSLLKAKQSITWAPAKVSTFHLTPKSSIWVHETCFSVLQRQKVVLMDSVYMQMAFLISFFDSISLEESRLDTILAQIFHGNSSAIQSTAADFLTWLHNLHKTVPFSILWWLPRAFVTIRLMSWPPRLRVGWMPCCLQHLGTWAKWGGFGVACSETFS